jgi:hypothetical protein
MLGKHPDEYPRFRDCFVDIDDKTINIYTRVGGGNRESHKDEIEELRKNQNYIRDYDDNFDNTFATFVFSIPEKWKIDFDKLINNKGNEISDEYKQELKRVFPKLAEKFDTIFAKK